MAKQPTLSDITNILNAATFINANWDAIQAAFQNTVSRDGSTPNQMEADLDLNNNDLLNVNRIDVGSLYVNGVNTVSTAAVPEWRGAWATATAYVEDDLVRQDGSSYICLVAHTSGTFATDLTDLKWELFAQQGSAGAGTGDMLAANNLSDVASAATSRSNLGLGSVSTENTVPISKGGTGATDATTAKTNLGLAIGTDVQAYDADLAAIAGLTSAANKVPYFTGSGTAGVLDFLDEDDMASDSATAVPSQQSVKSYVASNAGGYTLLGTLTTTSGASQSLTSLDLTGYKMIFATFKGVSHNSGSSQTFSFGGATITQAIGAALVVSGLCVIDLTNSVVTLAFNGSAVSIQPSAGTLTTASTSITVSVSGGNFDAGSIIVYGVI